MGAAALIGGVAPAAHGLAPVVARGNLRQSVARWCYSGMAIEDLCAAVAGLGMPAIDLLEIDEWPVARDHGLAVSVGMPNAGTIERGINDPRNHAAILDGFRTNIPKAAAAGVPAVITFFGNHVGGMRRADALRHSVSCMRECARVAEDNDTTIVIEMLNSKVDHIGYIGDRTAWGVEIVEAVGSERVKLLYDIYHMQIMEGDVIRTVRDNHQYFGHYHTGGVPGRAEIDASQELFYPAIARAILATGYDGYFAHEFIPRGDDPIGALAAAVELCDV
jgi:hydroxypyruvate isomerase